MQDVYTITLSHLTDVSPESNPLWGLRFEPTTSCLWAWLAQNELKNDADILNKFFRFVQIFYSFDWPRLGSASDGCLSAIL